VWVVDVTERIRVDQVPEAEGFTRSVKAAGVCEGFVQETAREPAAEAEAVRPEGDSIKV